MNERMYQKRESKSIELKCTMKSTMKSTGPIRHITAAISDRFDVMRHKVIHFCAELSFLVKHHRVCYVVFYH
jgi:hypothetical protein